MSLRLRPYEPSMSPDLSISQSTLDPESSLSSVERYSAALDALNASNHNLEYKLAKIQARNLRLKLDLMRLQRHITSFHHDLLATWEADILTSLIEVVYQRQGRKLHRGHDIDLRRLDRKALSMMYTIAAGRIGRRALRNLFGLSQHYWLALQKYDEIAHLRSTSPSRTEGTFARWLMTERETNPKRAGFWARLFPVCYDYCWKQPWDTTFYTRKPSDRESTDSLLFWAGKCETSAWRLDLENSIHSPIMKSPFGARGKLRKWSVAIGLCGMSLIPDMLF
ncbi:uncharacterized protein P174DRAFT_416829 [Aspergillus novofumigatus IBT 16806]|uniref:Uncharacterized protein n=1 Tax=Aspergillus novofumigatus (strain IBT 16806) TaxID=1392255 RepID=A0A2I1CNC8_ASPN1|nr:uncharacterized protein P174DRAFT_416829 [Aspergillus novofumigatus IBT 16806]PKX99131.1 hypothetical protein P174DRAFT_416829 [Aspergillus novofumigatus IBT 16806]